MRRRRPHVPYLRPSHGRLLQALALGVLYVAMARLQLGLMPELGPRLSPMWPVAGVMIAALATLGPGLWPAVALGEMATGLSVGLPLWTAAGIAVAVSAEIVVGAWLIRRGTVPAGAMPRGRNFFRYAVVGGVLAPLATAAGCAWVLELSGQFPPDRLGNAVLTWWLADAQGALLVTPLILVWRWERAWELARARVLEMGFLSVAVLLATAWSFSPSAQLGGHPLPLAFLPFPVLMWLSVRFDARGASVGTLVALCAVAWGTGRGGGPFTAFDDVTRGALMHLYVAALGVTGLVLAWEAERRRGLSLDLRRGNRVLDMIGRAQADFIVADERGGSLDGFVEQVADLTGAGCAFLASCGDGGQGRRWRLRGGRWRCPGCPLTDGSGEALKALLDGSGGAARVAGRSRPVALGAPEGVRCPAVEGRFDIWPIVGGGQLRGALVTEAPEAAGTGPSGVDLAPVLTTSSAFLDALAAQEAAREASAQREALESQLQAVQRIESLGMLAGGIAHDFNNVLTAIEGNAELLRMDLPSDHPSQAEVENILVAVARAAGITRQILLFSRREPARVVEVPVGPLLCEILKLLRASMPANVRLDLDMDPSAPPILADPNAVHQVVLNLCTNAMHAMAEGGGTLTLLLSPASGEDGAGGKPMVRLEVRDTGHGMDDAVRRRVFEPFFSTKGPGQGTGLGLSVAHGIVTALGGQMSVRSTPSEGSCFTLLFPASTPASTGEGAAPAHAPDEVRGRGERVVVVDDEASLVGVVVEILRRFGFDAVGTTSPTEALEQVGEAALLVTDLGMPAMDGWDLVAGARALRPGLPVVLMTGTVDVDAVRARTGRTGVHVLPKPFDQDALARAAHAALRTTVAWSQGLSS